MRALKASCVCGALATSIAGYLLSLGAFAAWSHAWFGAAGESPHFVVQWIGAAILAFSLAWTTVDIGPAALQLVVAVCALIETAALSWLLNRFGIAWPPFTALTAGALATLFGLLYNQSPGGRRKRLIQSLFKERISRRTARIWTESREPLDISGKRLEASVVVCEIFNDQLLSEVLSSQDYAAMTNGFLQTGAETLMEAGGLLNEGAGSRLSAIFGAPLPMANHAAQAASAACVLDRRLEAFCREAVERWKASPDYRIGVNSGELIGASYGSRGMAAYNVAGEPLEFCCRLCMANTFYGSRVLLGPKAFQLAAGEVEVRPMDLIRLPGQQAPEEIYELLAPKNALSPAEKERRDMFWRGVILFRERRWDEAVAYFQTALHGAVCEDAPVRFYLDRIAQLRAGEQALDWDTVKF